MNTQLTILHQASRTRAMTELVSGKQPVLALLMRLLWAAALVLPVFGAQGAVVLTTLYSFTGTSDGANPQAALVQGNDGNFYGTTCYGGTNNGQGTVFTISTTGALTTLYSFGSITNADGDVLDGAYPAAALVRGSNGSFYGTTEYNSVLPDPEGLGGWSVYGCGTVFRISTNGALTTLYSFTGTNDGENPCAVLVQGSDGSFYGTTQYGGTNNAGTVFRLTIVPPPQLTMIPSEPYVILTWPTDYNGFSYAGYALQSTTNLGSAAVWSTNSSPPVVIGGQNVIINTMSGAQQFYRLSQ